MVDLRLFFPDFLTPKYLIAAFLKGIQPSDLRLDFGLLVRQLVVYQKVC